MLSPQKLENQNQNNLFLNFDRKFGLTENIIC